MSNGCWRGARFRGPPSVSSFEVAVEGAVAEEATSALAVTLAAAAVGTGGGEMCACLRLVPLVQEEGAGASLVRPRSTAASPSCISAAAATCTCGLLATKRNLLGVCVGEHPSQMSFGGAFRGCCSAGRPRGCAPSWCAVHLGGGELRGGKDSSLLDSTWVRKSETVLGRSYELRPVLKPNGLAEGLALDDDEGAT